MPDLSIRSDVPDYTRFVTFDLRLTCCLRVPYIKALGILWVYARNEGNVLYQRL